jgi:hypothetical protein
MRPVAAAVSLLDLHSAKQRLDLGDSDQRGTHDRTAHRVAAWIDMRDRSIGGALSPKFTNQEEEMRKLCKETEQRL